MDGVGDGRDGTSPGGRSGGVSSHLGEPGVLVDVLSFVDGGLQLLQDASAARQGARQPGELPPSCKTRGTKSFSTRGIGVAFS